MMGAVMARLKAEASPPLNLVQGAGDFAALKAAPPKHLQPAAFVLPARSTGGTNSLATGFRQPLQESVAVVVMTSRLNDARGEASARELEVVLRAIRRALVGWSPGPGWAATEFVAGQMSEITDGVLIWQETFASAGHLRRQGGPNRA